MDYTASDIEICMQCQHKDCRYCRFNPKDNDKSTTDKSQDNNPITVESAISILRRKADEFYDKARCDTCLLSGKCWLTQIPCRTVFITHVLSGYIDADGNIIKKRHQQD